MNIRQRIALLIDPSLATTAGPDPSVYYRVHESAELHRIAASLERIEQKMVRRRQRVIECRHPELHGVDLEALGYN